MTRSFRVRGYEKVVSPVPMAMREKDKKDDFSHVGKNPKRHDKRITTISDPRAPL